MHSGPLILGGKCWNPALSESCLGLFNGDVWTAQKNCSPRDCSPQDCSVKPLQSVSRDLYGSEHKT